MSTQPRKLTLVEEIVSLLDNGQDIRHIVESVQNGDAGWQDEATSRVVEVTALESIANSLAAIALLLARRDAVVWREWRKWSNVDS